MKRTRKGDFLNGVGAGGNPSPGKKMNTDDDEHARSTQTIRHQLLDPKTGWEGYQSFAQVK